MENDFCSALFWPQIFRMRILSQEQQQYYCWPSVLNLVAARERLPFVFSTGNYIVPKPIRTNVVVNGNEKNTRQSKRKRADLCVVLCALLGCVCMTSKYNKNSYKSNSPSRTLKLEQKDMMILYRWQYGNIYICTYCVYGVRYCTTYDDENAEGRLIFFCVFFSVLYFESVVSNSKWLQFQCAPEMDI